MFCRALDPKIAWADMIDKANRDRIPFDPETLNFANVQKYINDNYNFNQRSIVAIVNKQGEMLADLSSKTQISDLDEADAVVKRLVANQEEEEVLFQLQG